MRVSNQKIMKRFVEILQEILQSEEGTPEVDGNCHLNALGLNSLERVDLICALEREFRISIPDEQISKFEKVNDFIDLINSAQEKRKPQFQTI